MIISNAYPAELPSVLRIVRQEKESAVKFDTSELPDKLSARLVSLSSEYPALDFLFTKSGVGCFPVGEISIIKGRWKSGKSNLLVGIMAALISGEYFGFECTKNESSVLYVDTEQNPVNTSILTRKVHQICGFPEHQDHPRFRSINLRGDLPDERRKLIKQTVNHLKPDVLIIDGAKDLLSNGDINDNKSTAETMQFLMALTRDFPLALITVIHENKGDSNARGAIGSELLNKCAECWQVKKTGENFDVEQIESRNEPTTGFSFTYDDTGLPISAYTSPKKQVETTDEKLIRNFKLLLPEGASFRYSDLKSKYSVQAGCSEKSAENHISKGAKTGFLKKLENGNYAFNYTQN